MRRVLRVLQCLLACIVAFAFGYFSVEIVARAATAVALPTSHAAASPVFDPTQLLTSILGSVGLGSYAA